MASMRGHNFTHLTVTAPGATEEGGHNRVTSTTATPTVAQSNRDSSDHAFEELNMALVRLAHDPQVMKDLDDEDDIEFAIRSGKATLSDYAQQIARLVGWANQNGSIASHGIATGAIQAIELHGEKVMHSQSPNATPGHRNYVSIQPQCTTVVAFTDSTYNMKRGNQNRQQADTNFGNKIREQGGFKHVTIEVEMGGTFRTLVNKLKAWVQRLGCTPEEVDAFIIIAFAINEGTKQQGRVRGDKSRRRHEA